MKVRKHKFDFTSRKMLIALFIGGALLTHGYLKFHEHWLHDVWQAVTESSAKHEEPAIQVLSEDPPVRVYAKLLSHKECKEIIRLVKHRLQESKVMVNGRPVSDYKIRSSTTAYLKPSDSPLVLDIQKRVCKLVNCETHQIEPLQVVHYSKGQLYRPHHDYFDPGDFDPALGQRLHTFLIYLNDLRPGEGGLTYFPNLNIRVKPKMGNALYFRDLDASGQPDPRTLHAGEEVTNSKVEKWAVNIWIRQKRYRDSQYNSSMK